MLVLKGNYKGVPLKIECGDSDHASLIINTLCLDDPLRF